LEGLSENDIYAIHEDREGNIWIGAIGTGLYHYDGKNFTLFNETDRPDLINNFNGIQNILEDKNGTIWLGFSGGLFCLDGSSMIHVAQNGPWK
jgi:ligand-binding sensor domain-containing protein